ncbi:MAG TPA: sugar transferase [Caulobacteraceae bacterium]|nr:sugar transferase [Caulobacteraceae bacterium]
MSQTNSDTFVVHSEAPYEINAVGSEADSKSELGLCRILDILIAATALVFFAPFGLLIALGIKICDGGPVFFGHSRIGYCGRAFRCWKFRSMFTDADARLRELLINDPVARSEWELDHKLRRDPRVTAIGAILRKTSLDELPQLYNVLRGEMSLIGPRPIVNAEIIRYGRWFQYYCAVKPGLSGLWQVSGRNDVSYRRRVAMDVAYARSQSPRLYVRILVATIPAVLMRKGSY